MPTGTAVSVTNATAVDVENRMRNDPRVADVGSLVGSTNSVAGTEVTNIASLSVTLKPNVIGSQAQQFVTQWTAALTGSLRLGWARTRVHLVHARADPALAGAVRTAGSRTAGLRPNDRHRPKHHLARTRLPTDSDLRPRHQQALRYRRVYGHSEAPDGVPGLQPPQPGITNAQPEIDVNVDRANAAQLGVSTQTISQVVDIATAGQTASFMQINGTQYPIEVQLPPDQRRSLQSIQNLMVPVSTVPDRAGRQHVARRYRSPPARTAAYRSIPPRAQPETSRFRRCRWPSLPRSRSEPGHRKSRAKTNNARSTLTLA